MVSASGCIGKRGLFWRLDTLGERLKSDEREERNWESILHFLAIENNRPAVECLPARGADLNAEVFEHPSKLLASGSAELRERYAGRFQEPNLHAVLLKRIVAGAVAVDHEKVMRTFPEGAGEIELVMIYEVKSGRIAKAWSIAGAKTIFPKP